MLSFWEKIDLLNCWVNPLCSEEHCFQKAQWIHRWQTQDSEEHADCYCEKHALEHGLANYEGSADRSGPGKLPRHSAQISGSPRTGSERKVYSLQEITQDLTKLERYAKAYNASSETMFLLSCQRQAEETTFPFGGSPKEEESMFEEDEDDE